MVQPIEPLRFFALLPEVDCFGGGTLHPIGQLIRRDSSGKFRAAGVSLLMLLVELREKVQASSLLLWSEIARWGPQIQDRVARRAEDCRLVSRRQVARAPIVRPV